MKASAQFLEVDDMQITVTLTGSVGEFKRLLSQVKDRYINPADTFTSAINQRIRAAETVMNQTSTSESE